MKKISPVNCWFNGENKQATIFDMYLVNGILGNNATFYYSLYDEVDGKPNQCLSYGNLSMNGEDYSNWGSDDDYAWVWGASKLNLEIIS